MRPGKILTRLIDLAPPLIEAHAKVGGRCIMATRIGIEVLKRHGIEANPVPVSVSLANKEYLSWRHEYSSPLAWGEAIHALGIEGMFAERDRRGAWILSVGQHFDAQGSGWNGHLILHVPALGRAVDLDVQQFRRPAKGIVVPDAWQFDWKDLSQGQGAWSGNGCRIEYDAEPTNLGYQAAKDWGRDHADLVDALVKLIRKPELDRIRKVVI